MRVKGLLIGQRSPRKQVSLEIKDIHRSQRSWVLLSSLEALVWLIKRQGGKTTWSSKTLEQRCWAEVTESIQGQRGQETRTVPL